jgi:hypothetical protein
MTSRPVDLDTLADYLEDLLPPAERATVADLIATDPSWSATLTALQAAQPRVIAALSAAGQDPTPMPADVLGRVDELRRSAVVVDLGARRASRLHRTVHSSLLKVAAALIVLVVGIGFLTQFARSQSSEKSASNTGAKAVAPQAVPAPPGLTIGRSGTDYTRADLTSGGNIVAGPSRFPTHAGPAPAHVPSPGAVVAPGSVPPALRRLLEPAALSDCLTAVEALTGRTPTGVDFALYQHDPALIFGFGTAGALIAVGPTCGEPGAGADVLG